MKLGRRHPERGSDQERRSNKQQSAHEPSHSGRKSTCGLKHGRQKSLGSNKAKGGIVTSKNNAQST